MAEEKPKEAAAKATKTDLVSEIGTLTYPRAVKYFGKENAIKVMQQVAAIGGHGTFVEDELRSPLFGGLMMPSPDHILPPDRAAFDKFPDPDFHYDEAMELYEQHKARAVADRAAINDLFNSLKS